MRIAAHAQLKRTASLFAVIVYSVEHSVIILLVGVVVNLSGTACLRPPLTDLPFALTSLRSSMSHAARCETTRGFTITHVSECYEEHPQHLKHHLLLL